MSVLVRAVACCLLPALAGCLRVEVGRTSQPGPIFAAERRLAMRYQGRPGPAREVRALVWSAEGRQLVQARVPMWLVKKVESAARDDRREESIEPGRAREDWARHLSLRDIDRAGLGLLFELEEEQGERVLVWLR